MLFLTRILDLWQTETPNEIKFLGKIGKYLLELRRYVVRFETSEDGGTWWRSWLRHCATSRKVVGSFPDGVIEIFH